MHFWLLIFLAVSNDKGGVALLPLTNWSTRRSSFVQDSPNAPSVTLKSFISSTSQRTSKNNRSNGKKDMGFYFVYCIHINIIYTERQREIALFGLMLNPPPPTPKSVSTHPQHLQSPAKGVLIFSTGILLLGCLRSPKKWENGKKIGKKNGKKTWGKKVCQFFNPHGKGSSSQVS